MVLPVVLGTSLSPTDLPQRARESLFGFRLQKFRIQEFYGFIGLQRVLDLGFWILMFMLLALKWLGVEESTRLHHTEVRAI